MTRIQAKVKIWNIGTFKFNAYRKPIDTPKISSNQKSRIRTSFRNYNNLFNIKLFFKLGFEMTEFWHKFDFETKKLFLNTQILLNKCKYYWQINIQSIHFTENYQFTEKKYFQGELKKSDFLSLAQLVVKLHSSASSFVTSLAPVNIWFINNFFCKAGY